MVNQLTDLETKQEYREVPVTDSDRQTSDHLIAVNSSRIRILQEAWQKRWNRLPNQTELQQLVDAWIHEEVLFRESLNRGLDRNDELVRRRLIQKMERPICLGPNHRRQKSWQRTMQPTQNSSRRQPSAASLKSISAGLRGVIGQNRTP
jgi:hypothetical protein